MWTRRAPRRLRFLAGPPAPVQRDVGSDPVSPGYCCPLVPGLTPTRALGRVGRVFWRGPTDPPGLAAPRPRRAPGPRSSGPRTCSAANAKTPGDLRGSRGMAGFNPAQCRLQSSARSEGHFAKCSPGARCCVPAGATERERRGAGSTRPYCGDRGRRVGDSGGCAAAN